MTRKSFLAILGISSVAAWAGVRATAQEAYKIYCGKGYFSESGLQVPIFEGEHKMTLTAKHKDLGNIGFHAIAPWKNLPPPEYTGPKVKYMTAKELRKRYPIK